MSNVELPIVSYYWEITTQSNGAILFSSTDPTPSTYTEIPFGNNGPLVNGTVTIIDSNGCEATEILDLQTFTDQV